MAKEETSQPVLNIGLVGHVDHGKTTLTERLSGKWTDTHSEELKRGITIRLGYANTSFWKAEDEAGNDVYLASDSKPKGYDNLKHLRRVSFIDAPGHESLMATMLSGATIMDAAILMVSASEDCPQPQTKEHLMALEIMGLKNVIVVQNKIDLVTQEKAMLNYKRIKKFLKDTSFEDAPIVPISAQHGINIDLLIKTIEERFTTPERNPSNTARMLIARSFDINKPGSDVENIVGGVIGGAIVSGEFKVGDDIEILPGARAEEKGKTVYKPVRTTVLGINSGSSKIDKATAGGSVAFMTNLDPAIIKSDALSGSIVGRPGELPPVRNDLTLKVTLLDRVVGMKDKVTVDNIKNQEMLMLNVNSTATVGVVYEIGKGMVKSKLKIPVCAESRSKVTISRRVGNRFRLIGFGEIVE